MKKEEELLKPIRNLWGAVLWQTVRDYRVACLYGDETGYAIEPGNKKALFEKNIANELEVMGYGEWLPKIKASALRVRAYMDKIAPTIKRGEKRHVDCPGCGGVNTLRVWYGRKRVCCHCEACEICYIYWRES